MRFLLVYVLLLPFLFLTLNIETKANYWDELLGTETEIEPKKIGYYNTLDELLGIESTEQTQPTEIKFVLYEDSESNFSIQIPDNWKELSKNETIDSVLNHTKKDFLENIKTGFKYYYELELYISHQTKNINNLGKNDSNYIDKERNVIFQKLFNDKKKNIGMIAIFPHKKNTIQLTFYTSDFTEYSPLFFQIIDSFKYKEIEKKGSNPLFKGVAEAGAKGLVGGFLMAFFLVPIYLYKWIKLKFKNKEK